MTPRLILASNSPRRQQILSLAGWPFTVRPVEIDERPRPGEPPRGYVLRLALAKAQAAAGLAAPGEVILTADTTVADGERILGKPADAAEARAMLRGLRGRAHTVYTAIGVFDAASGRAATDLCSAQVWMRSYADEEMEAYIASGDPFDKAGAYAIQNARFSPVERFEGCYACIVGLPLCHVVRLLAPFGFEPALRAETACPDALQIDTPCPAAEAALRGGGVSGPAG
jgi:MAF protein